MEPAVKNDYLDKLKEKNKKSHVYRKFQLTGLELAMYLEDEKHKSLYIKIAKFGDEFKLISLAKDVSERKSIENKGGYFMRIVFKNMPEVIKAFKKKEIADFLPQAKKQKSSAKKQTKKINLHSPKNKKKSQKANFGSFYVS